MGGHASNDLRSGLTHIIDAFVNLRSGNPGKRAKAARDVT